MTAARLPETAPIFSCPQCHTPVRASDTACPACGINLALAAVLAEGYTRAIPTRAGAGRVHATAELPRFGEFLVGQGYITPAQLQAGLARQREAAALGAHQAIGQTLVAMGAITRERLDQAGIEQVRQLQNALEESNRQLERRVLERTEALQAAVRQLTELNQLKANFIANISHELRTPMVPIKGYSDLLLNGSLGKLSAGQVEAVEAIHRSAQRLETLLSQLIQFASSVKGKLVVSPTILHVPDLLDPLWDFFQPKAEAGAVTLARAVPANLPLALADGEKIYWVLYQLLDNAIKFTPAGGQVVLTAAAGPSRLRLSVRDSGVGISAENLKLIFEPFAQASDMPAQLGGQLVDGTGLGLALVKRIVEAHDSRVEVESQVGQGSTFSFELPLANPAAHPAAENAPAAR
jgi:signal transduction histidine kinase